MKDQHRESAFHISTGYKYMGNYIVLYEICIPDLKLNGIAKNSHEFQNNYLSDR